MSQVQETHYLILICDVSGFFLAMRKMSFAHPRRVEWIRRAREVVERGDSDAAVGKNFIHGM